MAFDAETPRELARLISRWSHTERSSTLCTLTKSRGFAHVTGSFRLYLKVSLLKESCSLCKSFLLPLEALFFSETRPFIDLLSGNSSIVDVCKQHDKATWPPLTASFPLLIPAATRWFWDNATSFLQRITFPTHSVIPSDHPGNAVSQPPSSCHHFPCLIFRELEDLSWSLFKKSQSSTMVGV